MTNDAAALCSDAARFVWLSLGHDLMLTLDPNLMLILDPI